MSFLKVDHSKAGSGFEVLPAGEYEVIISKAMKKTASTGSLMLEMVLKVRDDVESQAQYKNRTLFHRIVFTENTEGIQQGFVKSLNIEDGTEFETIDDLVKYVKGRPVRAKVDVGSYQGNATNEVKYTKVSEAGAVEIEGDSPFGDADVPPPSDDDDDNPFA